MTDAQVKALSLTLLRTKHGMFRDCSICHESPRVIRTRTMTTVRPPWTMADLYSAGCCGYTCGWYHKIEGAAEAWNGMVQQIQDDIESSLDERDFIDDEN